jgi:hypothetical protein
MSNEHCPTCGRDFTSRTALGVHQGRNRPCHDPDAARQRARERSARYRARDPERRRRQVREARRRLTLHRPDYFRMWRAAHAEGERARRLRWRYANPELLRAQRRRRADRRRPEVVPLPPSHAHHPLFDKAWEILHAMGVRRDDHLVVVHDPRWEDACSEAVLALLEGRDAQEAARAVLAVERRHAIVRADDSDLERLTASA